MALAAAYQSDAENSNGTEGEHGSSIPDLGIDDGRRSGLAPDIVVYVDDVDQRTHRILQQFGMTLTTLRLVRFREWLVEQALQGMTHDLDDERTRRAFITIYQSEISTDTWYLRLFVGKCSDDRAKQLLSATSDAHTMKQFIHCIEEFFMSDLEDKIVDESVEQTGPINTQLPAQATDVFNEVAHEAVATAEPGLEINTACARSPTYVKSVKTVQRPEGPDAQGTRADSEEPILVGTEVETNTELAQEPDPRASDASDASDASATATKIEVDTEPVVLGARISRSFKRHHVRNTILQACDLRICKATAMMVEAAIGSGDGSTPESRSDEADQVLIENEIARKVMVIGWKAETDRGSMDHWMGIMQGMADIDALISFVNDSFAKIEKSGPQDFLEWMENRYPMAFEELLPAEEGQDTQDDSSV